MADFENVVKSLEICLTNSTCNDCWYFNNAQYGECHGNMMRDALELLKAQTPIKPIRDSFLNWRCGNCRREIDKYAGEIYCPGCGRKVAWG